MKLCLGILLLSILDLATFDIDKVGFDFLDNGFYLAQKGQDIETKLVFAKEEDMLKLKLNNKLKFGENLMLFQSYMLQVRNLHGFNPTTDRTRTRKDGVQTLEMSMESRNAKYKEVHKESLLLNTVVSLQSSPAGQIDKHSTKVRLTRPHRTRCYNELHFMKGRAKRSNREHFPSDYNNADVAKTRVKLNCVDCKNLKGLTPLYQAVVNNHAEIATRFLQAGADLHQKFFLENRNLLHEAARLGAVVSIRWLVEKGLDVNGTDDRKWTPLHYSAWSGQLNATKTLIDLKCCIDCRDSFGKTALYESLTRNDISTAAVLVKAGANLSQKFSNNHRNLLHATAAEGAVSSIKWLVEKGFHVNATDDDKWTALHYSAYNGKLNATKSLLQLNSCIDCRDSLGQTPIFRALTVNNIDVAEVLLEAGADLQQTITSTHRKIIHEAAAFGASDTIRWLVQNGIDVNSTNDFKMTPLHFSTGNGKWNATKTLVDLGCCIDCRDSNGITALYKALAINNIAIATLLVKAGADLHQTITSTHRKIIHEAAAFGASDTIRWLVQNGIDVNSTNDLKMTSLHFSAGNGKWNATKTLVDLGCCIDCRDSNGITALYKALAINNIAIATLLVKAGADLHQTITSTHRKLIHEAAALGASDSIRWLVQNGIDVNSTNDLKMTPLHFSAGNGKWNATKTLVDLGCCIDCRDSNGITALYKALAINNIAIATLLVKAGADLHQTITSTHRKLIHEAAALGASDSIRWLVQNGIDVNSTNDLKMTPLHFSAGNGKWNATKTLVDLGCCIDCRDSNGITALYKALAINNIAIATLLVQAGADLHQTFLSDHRNLLHVAASLGAVGSIRWLVVRSININATDDNLWTPIHYAARHGRLNATITLLSLNSCINCRNSYDLSPLIKALSYSHIEVAAVLVRAGADLHQTFTSDQRNILHEAAALGAVNVIRWVVQNGITVNSTNEKNMTALHFAASNGRLNAIKALVAMKSCIDCKDSGGETALYKVVTRNDISTAAVLVKAGANLYQKVSIDHRNLLHAAAAKEAVSSIKWLVEKGIHVNATDDDQWTALHYAAYNGKMYATKTLLELNSCIDCRTSKDTTPLLKALTRNNIAIATILVIAGADVHQTFFSDHRSLIHVASASDASVSIRWLVKRGLSVNAKDDDNWTPLHFAVSNGKLNATKTLVHLNCCIDCRNVRGFTALNTALANNYIEIATVLVEAGADLHQTFYSDHRNELHEAAAKGHLTLIRWLVQKGISVNSTDDNNLRPIHFAAGNGLLNATKTLVALNSCRDCKTKKGNTPLRLAELNHHADVVNFLKSK